MEAARMDAGRERPTEAEQQHLRALELANRVRQTRAEMKRGIAAGALTAAEVVLDCPWWAQSMAISDVVMSQKRWGHARCHRLLQSIGVPENKEVATLTERQRRALVNVLDPKRAPAADARGAARERMLSAA
jgi:hypothetical protein